MYIYIYTYFRIRHNCSQAVADVISSLLSWERCYGRAIMFATDGGFVLVLGLVGRLALKEHNTHITFRIALYVYDTVLRFLLSQD